MFYTLCMMCHNATSEIYENNDYVLLGTRRYCNVESTSSTLIQSRNNVVCPVGASLHREP